MRRCALILAGFALVLIAAASAGAGGFAVTEKGASGLGNAYAGGAAVAEDAGTVYWNPAGMTRLAGHHAAASLVVNKPSYEFQSAQTASNALGLPIEPTGVNGGDAGSAVVVPNIFYSHSVSDQLKVGIDIVVPYSLDTQYDSLWVGRYYAVKSELKTWDINPAVAYRISDRWSLGGGISAQYLDAELTNAVDFGLINALDLGNAFPLIPSTPTSDGSVQVSGDNWGVGFNLGALFELSENTRFGFTYRSKVGHTLDGQAGFTYPAAAPGIGAATGLVNQNVRVNIDLPAIASLSGYHQIGKWALMGDITWTQWSSLDELRIDYANAGVADDVTTLSWDDTIRISVGATWQYHDQLTWRAGLAYDQTPVPSAERQAPEIPSEDSVWLSLGGSWKFAGPWDLDFGAAYIWSTGDANINKSTASPPARDENTFRGNVAGSYDVSAYSLGLQINYNF